MPRTRGKLPRVPLHNLRFGKSVQRAVIVPSAQRTLSWPAGQMRPLGAERTCVAAGRHSPREPGLQHVQGPASWRMAACELAAQKGGHCLPLRPPPVTPRRLFPCLPLTETRGSKSPLRHLLPPPESRVNRRTQSLAHRPCGVWACSTGPGPGEGDLLPSRLWSPASWPPKLPWPRQPHSQLPGAKPTASQQAG